jgi:hypothetical protein
MLRVVGVGRVDFDLHREDVDVARRVRVPRGGDPGDAAGHLLARVGVEKDAGFLVEMHLGDVDLVQVDLQEQLVHLGDRELGLAVDRGRDPGGHDLAGLDVSPDDHAVDRRRDVAVVEAVLRGLELDAGALDADLREFHLAAGHVVLGLRHAAAGQRLLLALALHLGVLLFELGPFERDPGQGDVPTVLGVDDGVEQVAGLNALALVDEDLADLAAHLALDVHVEAGGDLARLADFVHEDAAFDLPDERLVEFAAARTLPEGAGCLQQEHEQEQRQPRAFHGVPPGSWPRSQRSSHSAVASWTARAASWIRACRKDDWALKRSRIEAEPCE